jgi:Ca2+-binding EF-hand superfamily protein
MCCRFFNRRAEAPAESPRAPIDAEGLLRLLLEKVQDNGVAVDEAFRHFDLNGDGSITRQELVQGLTKLRIFEHVPNWKAQLPGLLKKFDVDGNGEVSLREFFKYVTYCVVLRAGAADVIIYLSACVWSLVV